MSKPIESTFPAYFKKYIDQVKEDELNEAFKNQQQFVDTYFDSIPEEKTNTGYAPGKWSLKELLQHVIDTERVFNYRALAFARKETASLPGFDENDYAANSNANERSWKSLCEEFKIVRRSTELMFRSFSDEALQSSGLANNNPMSVLAMGFTTIGHVIHHKKVIEERYL
ncbi:MAG: DinB family protein [Ferruginibacter sp.]